MSESVVQPGFGPRLKAEREARTLTVAKVAEKLKLTPRQIEALEEEDLSQLPSAVFVRGFIRNYARLVELDPESLIPPVDAEAAVSETITAPSEGVRFATSGVKRWVVLPLLGLAGFFALVALLYHWLRQGEDALLTAPPATQPELVQSLPAPAATLAPAPPAAAPVQEPAPGPVPAPPQSPAPQSPEPAMAPPPTASVPPAPLAAPAPVPATPAPATPAQAAPAAPAVTEIATGKHSLRFEPGADAWIQVVDAKGRRFSKLVRAGSVEVFAGETPFRLVVGEASQVRLSFDGHKIDLSPFIGQKVARLTLE